MKSRQFYEMKNMKSRVSITVSLILLLISLGLSAPLDSSSAPRAYVQIRPNVINTYYGGTVIILCNATNTNISLEEASLVWQCYIQGDIPTPIECAGNKAYRNRLKFGDCSVRELSESSCELKVELVRTNFTCQCRLGRLDDICRVYVQIPEAPESHTSEELNIDSSTISINQATESERSHEKQENSTTTRDLVIVIVVLIVIIIILLCMFLGKRRARTRQKRGHQPGNTNQDAVDAPATLNRDTSAAQEPANVTGNSDSCENNVGGLRFPDFIWIKKKLRYKRQISLESRAKAFKPVANKVEKYPLLELNKDGSTSASEAISQKETSGNVHSTGNNSSENYSNTNLTRTKSSGIESLASLRKIDAIAQIEVQSDAEPMANRNFTENTNRKLHGHELVDEADLASRTTSDDISSRDVSINCSLNDPTNTITAQIHSAQTIQNNKETDTKESSDSSTAGDFAVPGSRKETAHKESAIKKDMDKQTSDGSLSNAKLSTDDKSTRNANSDVNSRMKSADNEALSKNNSAKQKVEDDFLLLDSSHNMTPNFERDSKKKLASNETCYKVHRACQTANDISSQTEILSNSESTNNKSSGFEKNLITKSSEKVPIYKKGITDSPAASEAISQNVKITENMSSEENSIMKSAKKFLETGDKVDPQSMDAALSETDILRNEGFTIINSSKEDARLKTATTEPNTEEDEQAEIIDGGSIEAGKSDVRDKKSKHDLEIPSVDKETNGSISKPSANRKAFVGGKSNSQVNLLQNNVRANGSSLDSDGGSKSADTKVFEKLYNEVGQLTGTLQELIALLQSSKSASIHEETEKYEKTATKQHPSRYNTQDYEQISNEDIEDSSTTSNSGVNESSKINANSETNGTSTVQHSPTTQSSYNPFLQESRPTKKSEGYCFTSSNSASASTPEDHMKDAPDEPEDSHSIHAHNTIDLENTGRVVRGGLNIQEVQVRVGEEKATTHEHKTIVKIATNLTPGNPIEVTDPPISALQEATIDV